jgi:hypothetical protein
MQHNYACSFLFKKIFIVIWGYNCDTYKSCYDIIMIVLDKYYSENSNESNKSSEKL